MLWYNFAAPLGVNTAISSPAELWSAILLDPLDLICKRILGLVPDELIESYPKPIPWVSFPWRTLNIGVVPLPEENIACAPKSVVSKVFVLLWNSSTELLVLNKFVGHHYFQA